MAEALLLPPPGVHMTAYPEDAAHRLHRRVLGIAGRLAALLGPDHEASAFLVQLGGRAAPAAPRPQFPHPVDRLADGLGLGPAEVDVVLLAGAAEEHEGLATILRELHPRGHPASTAGLVASLAAAGLLPGVPGDEGEARLWARALLVSGSMPLFVEGPAGPFPERDVVLPAGLWTALRGEPGWPGRARVVDPELVAATPPGLQADRPDVRAALLACAGGTA